MWYDRAIYKNGWVRRKSIRSVVYYAVRSDGLVKIGFSTSLMERLRELRNAYGPMELLAYQSGGRMVEAEMHRRFATLRVRHEWFRPSRELMAHIEGLARG